MATHCLHSGDACVTSRFRGLGDLRAHLGDHACLSYTYLASGESWRFFGASGQEEAVTVKGPLGATNGEALAFALEAGQGIALQPDLLAWEAVSAGRLQVVMQDWKPAPLAIHLVTLAGGPRAPRHPGRRCCRDDLAILARFAKEMYHGPFM